MRLLRPGFFVVREGGNEMGEATKPTTSDDRLLDRGRVLQNLTATSDIATDDALRRAFGTALMLARGRLDRVTVARGARLSYWRLCKLEYGKIWPTPRDIRQLAKVLPDVAAAVEPYLVELRGLRKARTGGAR